MRVTVLLISFIPFYQISAQTNTDSTFRIAFGSCLIQGHAQDIWYKVLEKAPQVFIFLGDNVYGDTRNMDQLQSDYELLFTKPGLQELMKQTRVLATWDDHDYGRDNAVRNFSKKKESKEIFLKFFDPDNSERRNREGIYYSYMFGDSLKVQIILLDTRWFRQRFVRATASGQCLGPYDKMRNSRRTMLGEDQWKWLEGELSKEADIRIIGSGTQFLADFNGHEAWINMPHERERMMALIEEVDANGVIFISGDAHYSELSRLKRKSGYTFFDHTSSGMTHGSDCIGPNRLRMESAFPHPNFGLISIHYKERYLRFETIDEQGNTVISHRVLFSELHR